MSDGHTVYILKRLECEQLPLLLSHHVSCSLYKLHFYYQRNVSLPAHPCPPCPRQACWGGVRPPEAGAPAPCLVFEPRPAQGPLAATPPGRNPAQQFCCSLFPHPQGDPLTSDLLESFPISARRQGKEQMSVLPWAMKKSVSCLSAVVTASLQTSSHPGMLWLGVMVSRHRAHLWTASGDCPVRTSHSCSGRFLFGTRGSGTSLQSQSKLMTLGLSLDPSAGSQRRPWPKRAQRLSDRPGRS